MTLVSKHELRDIACACLLQVCALKQANINNCGWLGDAMLQNCQVCRLEQPPPQRLFTVSLIEWAQGHDFSRTNLCHQASLLQTNEYNPRNFEGRCQLFNDRLTERKLLVAKVLLGSKFAKANAPFKQPALVKAVEQEDKCGWDLNRFPIIADLLSSEMFDHYLQAA